MTDRYWRRLLPIRARPERVVDDELAFHLEMRVQDYVRRGMSPEAARREALSRFGDLESVRAECRHLEHGRAQSTMRERIFQDLWQDVRLGARTLAKRPIFVITAAFTLGIGIAANTAIFSMVNGLLLQPLAVRDPGQIMVIGKTSRSVPVPVNYFSVQSFRDIREQRTVFSDAVAYTPSFVGLRASAETDVEPRWVEEVGGNYFGMLGLAPELGRLLSEDDDRQRLPVIVLGHALWRTRFGGDPRVLGRAVGVNGVPFTVVGVTPANFRGTEQILDMDAYIPLGTDRLLGPGRDGLYDVGGSGAVRVLARLRDGVSLDAARATIRVLGARLAKQYPDESQTTAFLVVPELRARPTISVSSVVPWAAAVFMALVGLVMLIACVNVANLMLARAATRRPEMALRHALGASNGRVLRQLLTESVLVSLLGLVVGGVLAKLALDWLGSQHLASDMPINLIVAPDWRVFSYSVLVALVSGVVTGIAPALRGARAEAGEVLREAGRGMVGGRRRSHGVLIVAQIAISLVLLVCAGLFARSVRAAARIDLGFRTERMLLMSTDVSVQRYDSTRARRFAHCLADEAATMTGVSSAALATFIPLGFNVGGNEVFPDQDVPGLHEGHSGVLANHVSPDYFATLGVPLLEGRGFTRTDTAGAPLVGVINRTMADKFWPGTNAIGRHVRLVKDGPLIEIVGVARDGKYIFVNEKPQPFLYMPLQQRSEPITTVVLFVRAKGDAAALTPAARALIRSIDRDLPVFDVKTMETHLQFGQAYFFMRLAALLATAVGVLGLVQTLVGLYGVIAYGVSRRTREFGVRLALGARPGDITRGVVRQGLTLTLVGVTTGLVIALVVTRAMSGLLIGVGAFDVVTYGLAALVLATLATFAAYVPAWRASRLTPIAALRDE